MLRELFRQSYGPSNDILMEKAIGELAQKAGLSISELTDIIEDRKTITVSELDRLVTLSLGDNKMTIVNKCDKGERIISQTGNNNIITLIVNEERCNECSRRADRGIINYKNMAIAKADADTIKALNEMEVGENY